MKWQGEGYNIVKLHLQVKEYNSLWCFALWIAAESFLPLIPSEEAIRVPGQSCSKLVVLQLWHIANIFCMQRRSLVTSLTILFKGNSSKEVAELSR